MALKAFSDPEAFATMLSQGSGLGLAMARQLAELHEGRLSIDPREGGGNQRALHPAGDPRTPAGEPGRTLPNRAARTRTVGASSCWRAVRGRRALPVRARLSSGEPAVRHGWIARRSGARCCVRLARSGVQAYWRGAVVFIAPTAGRATSRLRPTRPPSARSRPWRLRDRPRQISRPAALPCLWTAACGTSRAT